MGRESEALALYDKAIEEIPTYNYNYYKNKSDFLVKMGRESEALVLYDKAIEKNPTYYNYYKDKADLLVKTIIKV